MKHFRLPQICSVTWAYFYLFILIGVFAGVLGPTIPSLARSLDYPFGRMGVVFSARSGGFMIGALALGHWFEKHDGHRLMIFGLLLTAVTLILVPAAGSFPLLLLVFGLMGASESSLDVGGNTLLARLHGTKVAPYMNAMHFCFGLGATLSPLLVAEMLRRGVSLWGIYGVTAALTLSGTPFLLRRKTPRISVSAAAMDAQKADGLTLKLFLFALLFLFYVGAEVGFGGWIPTLILRHGLADEVGASQINALFWGSFAAARLVGIFLATRFSPERLIAIDIALFGIGVALYFVLPTTLTSFAILACLIGAGMSSFFPSVMSYANRIFGLSGRVTSIFLVASGVGIMLVPWVMGMFLDAQGPQAAMLCLGVDVFLVLVCFLAILTK